EVDEGARGPDLGLDLLARDDLARTPREQQQDLERLRLQPDGGAVAPQLAATDVELEWTEAQRDEPRLRRVVQRVGRALHHGSSSARLRLVCLRRSISLGRSFRLLSFASPFFWSRARHARAPTTTRSRGRRRFSRVIP